MGQDLGGNGGGGPPGVSGYAHHPMGLYAIQQGVANFSFDAWGNSTPTGGGGEPDKLLGHAG